MSLVKSSPYPSQLFSYTGESAHPAKTGGSWSLYLLWFALGPSVAILSNQQLLAQTPTTRATSQIQVPGSSQSVTEQPSSTGSAPQRLTVDRVVYGAALPRQSSLWNATASVVLVGKIDKLDQQRLEIVEADGKRRQLTSDRIERIEVSWDTDEAAAAHERFAQRQYREVLKRNDEVLRAGGFPRWQQCILLAEIVESLEAIGKPELAGRYFLVLADLSPPDFLLATIPLNWTSRELTPALAKEARTWLEMPDEYAGLLGASWLLLADERESAMQRLQKLQSSSSKSVQRLAAMQLWRAVPPSETTSRLNRWMEARDTLSLPMQLGPSEFLAERLARVDKTDLAVGEWLRIASLYGDDHPYRASLALEAIRSRIDRLPQKLSPERLELWHNDLSSSPRSSRN